MGEVFLKELHQYHLAAVKALLGFCEEHGLTYYIKDKRFGK